MAGSPPVTSGTLSTELEEPRPPWLVNKALKKPPPPTDNFDLESFISKLQNSIINPHILKRNIPDNLSKEKRAAIFEIKNWDDRIVRLQDKGA